jgi:hypothetical protein
MPITPIDLQTNIGQMHEVARKEHAHGDSVNAQIHHLDKEADDKSNNANSRLDESREAQNMTGRLDDRTGGGQKRKKRNADGTQEETRPKRKVEMIEDENLGRVIDIKK